MVQLPVDFCLQVRPKGARRVAWNVQEYRSRKFLSFSKLNIDLSEENNLVTSWLLSVHL